MSAAELRAGADGAAAARSASKLPFHSSLQRHERPTAVAVPRRPAARACHLATAPRTAGAREPPIDQRANYAAGRWMTFLKGSHECRPRPRTAARLLSMPARITGTERTRSPRRATLAAAASEAINAAPRRSWRRTSLRQRAAPPLNERFGDVQRRGTVIRLRALLGRRTCPKTRPARLASPGRSPGAMAQLGRRSGRWCRKQLKG